MHYLLRSATLVDAAELSRLSIDTFNETFDHYEPEALQAHFVEYYNEGIWKRDIADAALSCIVAEEGGRLVGYAKTGPYKLPMKVAESPVRELHRLYVRKSHHGLGIGKALMEKMLEEFKQAGAKAALLGVWEHNRNAQAFYAKHGFAVVGEYRYPPIGDAIDRELIMKRVF